MQSSEMKSFASALQEILEGAKAEREELQDTFDLLGNYILPRKAFFTSTSQSSIADRERMMLDGTAPHSVMIFASMMQTYMANPLEEWARVSVDDVGTDVLEDDNVKGYLDLSSRAVRAALNRPMSATYTTLHEHNLDLGCFGSGVSMVLDDRREGGVYISHEPLHNCWFEDDDYGQVDMLIRKRCWNVSQAVRHFPGKNLGPSFTADRDATKGQRPRRDLFNFIIRTRDPRVADLVPSDVPGPYVSVWLSECDNHIISVDTVPEFRGLVSRWTKADGFPYGRSVGMVALGDILMVNRMAEVILRGAEKLTDPPLVFPDGGLLSPVRMYPGGITYSDGEVNFQPLLAPGASRIEVGAAMLAERQQAIRDSFFVPFLITPTGPQKTATEVLQHRDERNRLLAPMLIRQEQELYDRLVLLTYKILVRNGKIPPPPPELGRFRAKVEYQSPLVFSQLQNRALSTIQFLEQVALVGQLDPKAFDKVDIDASVDQIHIGTGAPRDVIRTSVALNEKRKRDRADLEQAQLAMAAKGAVEASAKLTAANRPR